MTEPDDVTRRTHLANERTYLAWWRTALASIAVGIGVGRILPEVVGGTVWPYAAVGVAWLAIGIVMAVYALVRVRAVDRALAERSFAHASDRMFAAFAIAAAGLGAVTALLVIASP